MKKIIFFSLVCFCFISCATIEAMLSELIQSLPEAPQGDTTSLGHLDENIAEDRLNEVIELVNIERTKLGLNPLETTISLQNASNVRAIELIEKFSHNRPNGTSPFTALDEYKIVYSMAGENIASGQRTPREVMNSWMNSTGHRKNILTPEFTHIGVGFSNYNWVQLFIEE